MAISCAVELLSRQRTTKYSALLQVKPLFQRFFARHALTRIDGV
jgi:hypothetical protein